MSAASVEGLAGEAFGWFERKARGDETITVLKDDAPDWVRDVVYAAHGDLLPDDWRYQTIRNAIGWIHDNGDDEDAHEFADGEVDVYTGARLAWLASNLTRAGYVDEATDELGHSDSGIIGDIGLGQYMECREVYQSVRQSLFDALESREVES